MLNCLFCILKILIRSQEDDLDIRVKPAGLLHKFNSGHLRHLDIRQQQMGRKFL